MLALIVIVISLRLVQALEGVEKEGTLGTFWRLVTRNLQKVTKRLHMSSATPPQLPQYRRLFSSPESSSIGGQ